MLSPIVITEIERDKLHREIERTQGKLTSHYELHPLTSKPGVMRRVKPQRKSRKATKCKDC
ncbi:hypothetical protein [Neisseria zalophi]|uniref:hypothetical protein n=1 Tax=Neisseria zalophi TaxID=640030 RepID=UPI0012441C66|nr:hypothetical protein [Neisseria zalophi]